MGLGVREVLLAVRCSVLSVAQKLDDESTKTNGSIDRAAIRFSTTSAIQETEELTALTCFREMGTKG